MSDNKGKIPLKKELHLFLALKRKKDNDTDFSKKVFRWVIRDYDKDLFILESIISNWKGVWRIYKTVNARDPKKAKNLLTHKLIDMEDGNESRIDSLWKTCLLQPSSRVKERKFLVDIDDEKLLDEVQKRLNEKGVLQYQVVKTPNGWHIVTSPFDKRIFNDLKDVEVKTDGYVFVKKIEVN